MSPNECKHYFGIRTPNNSMEIVAGVLNKDPDSIRFDFNGKIGLDDESLDNLIQFLEKHKKPIGRSLLHRLWVNRWRLNLFRKRYF